jgi:hypothetical protein
VAYVITLRSVADPKDYPQLAIREAVDTLTQTAEGATAKAAMWRRGFLRLQSELNEPNRDPLQALQICQRIAHETRQAIERETASAG